MTDLIERELSLPAPADDVWDAVTDPDRLAGWLADEVTLELWPGGEASFRFGDEVRAGWVEEVAAPTEEESGRLAFWWAQDDEPASRVELIVTALDELVTSLRVVETRPLEILDLVGIPIRGYGQTQFGPSLVAA
jgi:uncharacterized protein YndB with AHSA1/START domain